MLVIVPMEAVIRYACHDLISIISVPAQTMQIVNVVKH